MTFKKIPFLLILLCGISFSAFSQKNLRDSVVYFTYLGVHAGLHLPNGDLADRFGGNAHIGGNVGIKTKRNWLWEAGGSFINGNIIREPGFLQNIATSDGFVINIAGEPADVRANERGYYGYLAMGKLFPILSPNPNSGFVVKGGAAFLQHRIRVADMTNSTPQVMGNYEKGYDRLSYGFGLYEFVGYQFHSNRRLINFTIGFEFLQVSTQNKRPINFDTGKSETKKRVDLLNGFRIGWVFPLYKKTPSEFYYN